MDAHAHESFVLPIMEEDVIFENSSFSQGADVTPRTAEKDVVLGWRWGLEEDPDITRRSHSGRLDAATQSITQPGVFRDLEPMQVDIENYEGRWLDDDPTAVDLPGQFPYRFLQNAASSLEHLTYTGVPEQWYNSEPSIPHLPKLKSLHIGGWNDRETPFSMFPLAIAFPQIEQLWIGPDVPNLDPGPMAHSQDKWEGVWPHLKVLIFDASIVEDIEPVPLSGLRHLMCINRGNSLLHLLFVEILPDEGDAHEIRDIFSNDDDRLPDFDVIRHSDFRNLRSVQSRSMWILPDRARTMLSNSLANGQLTSFDIGFPDHRHSIELPRGDLSVRHLKAYDWLRGAPSIHTLGCFGFDFRLDPKNDEYLPLPQFLATFPNLRTLRLAGQYEGENKNENENDFASLILAIMSVTHLKTIYMSSSEFQSDSYALRRVEEAAQSKGVQILTRWFYGEEMWPEQWPMPLES
ncbi:hypothetical protein E4U11_004225 [Claviceps purpurea]|nr:hypothetical protein E4U11_004225 [Claviceps purpurea]